MRSGAENPRKLAFRNQNVGNHARAPRRIPLTASRTRRPAVADQHRSGCRRLQRLAQSRNLESLERGSPAKMQRISIARYQDEPFRLSGLYSLRTAQQILKRVVF